MLLSRYIVVRQAKKEYPSPYECITMMNYYLAYIMCRRPMSLPIRRGPLPHFPRGLFYPACYLIT
jgi:hypothetical protein